MEDEQDCGSPRGARAGGSQIAPQPLPFMSLASETQRPQRKEKERRLLFGGELRC